MLSSSDGFLLLAADPSSRLLLLPVSSLSTRCRFVLSDDRVFGCDNARLLCVTMLRVVDGIDDDEEEEGRFVDTSSSARVRRRPLVRRPDLGRVGAFAAGTAVESSTALDLRLIPEYAVVVLLLLSFGVDDPILL